MFWGHRHVKGGKDNGVHDFWGENSNSGKQVAIEVKCGENESIHSKNKWVTKAGQTIATDSRIISFSSDKSGRIIDYTITIYASEGDIVLMDDKDAGMGFRIPDTMCVNPHGTAKVNAQGYMLNSEGITGAACWGKKAKWIDYSGLVEGEILGVAMFDHPENPRHPTWWHARDYGLVAANPFGIHNFERKPKGTGNLKILKGSDITFRYRFLFHEGDAEGAKIAARYANWAKTSK